MRPFLAWPISLDRTFNGKSHPQMWLAKLCLRVEASPKETAMKWKSSQCLEQA